MRQRLCVRALIAVCAVSLVLPAAVYADATLLDDSREINALLDLTDAGGTNLWGPTTVPATFGEMFDEFLDYSGFSPAFAAEGEVYVDQLSSFNGVGAFSSLTARGLASGEADTGFDAFSAQVDGESEFLIEFSIDEAHNYTLSGMLTETGGSGSFARVRLREVDGDTIFIANDTIDFSDEGTLEAGEYELQAKASVLRTASSSTFFMLSASYENVMFDLTPVPEPQTLALLALAGLAVVRKCRRA